MLDLKRWLFLTLVLATLATIAPRQAGRAGISTAEAAFPGPEGLQVTGQQCLPSGRVRVSFAWTSFNTGPQWLDLSLASNGFAPNTFIGLGPLPANQGQFTWDGLLAGATHFTRINAFVAGGWFASNTLVFTTMSCSQTGSNAPGADNLALQSQSCIDGGRVRVVVGWTTFNAGTQWLDLSLANNGFAPGTFVGLGPLLSTQSQQVWDGLLANSQHYMRLNTLTANGWFPSNLLTFTTMNCVDDFTTAAKTVVATTTAQVTLTNVEFGAHPADNYDRLVFTFTGGVPAATIQYGGQPLFCGSGNAVTLGGVAVLHARFVGTVAHNDSGVVTVNTNQLLGSPEAIVEAKQICDFEGVVEWVLGTDRVAPFKVSTLSNPARIVIDVRR